MKAPTSPAAPPAPPVARGVRAALAGLAAALIGLAPLSAMGQAPQRLRVVGGLAAVKQFTQHEEPFWSRELERLSGGRYRAEIVPQDRAGIRPQEMLTLVQGGVVPMGTLLLSASGMPELAAPDLPGLNPDVGSLRRTVAAYRPHLERVLERRGIRLLAVYAYPAQALFCNRAFAGLRDLAGRRVRTSSPAMSDFVEALGARASTTAFADIVYNLRSGNIDCAVTGTMSGNTIGLSEHTTHLHAMALSWGLSAFVVHAATWTSLPAELRSLLSRELPRLEARIWDEAVRDTGMGIECNTGSPGCAGGKPGAMTLVPASADDERLRREIVASSVLPRFVERCGGGCAEAWNQALAPVTGFTAPTR